MLAVLWRVAMMSMSPHDVVSLEIPEWRWSMSSFASIINAMSCVCCHSFIALVRSLIVCSRGSGAWSPAILATAHCWAYAVLCPTLSIDDCGTR